MSHPMKGRTSNHIPKWAGGLSRYADGGDVSVPPAQIRSDPIKAPPPPRTSQNPVGSKKYAPDPINLLPGSPFVNPDKATEWK